MKLGWLHDDVGIYGGSEISEGILRANAPKWADVVLCPPNKRPPDVDAFVVQNCLTYDARWIEEFDKKPVVKVTRDDWHAGSIVLRQWILDNADLLIFGSLPHYESFCEQHNWIPNVRHTLIPPPVDVERFRQAAQREREGNVWLGRIEPGKGVHLAIDWALRNDEPLDIYGETFVDYIDRSELPDSIHFHGRVKYDDVPAIFGRARRFLFFPVRQEGFSRTTVEAWAAGCELLTNRYVSAMWWIEKSPGILGEGINLFWKAVYDTIVD